jgi:hypothetical protein
MMAVSLGVTEVKEQIQFSAEDRRLMKLWAALPAWQPIPEDEAHARICEAAGKWQGDGAFGSAMVIVLQNMGAVTVSGGSVRRSDDWPQLPDLTIGSDAYNALLERENRQQREREIENDNRVARQNFEQSPQGRQQRETRELVAEQVDEVLKQRLAEVADEVIEERVEALLRRLEPEALKRAKESLERHTG